MLRVSWQTRMIRFVQRQVRQIREGGIPVLSRKVISLLGMALSLPITLPAVMIVRLVRPLLVIRFGRLYSERIGHFAANTEVYLCECDAGVHGRTLNVFYYNQPICNHQLKKMWDRILLISQFAKWLDRLNRWLPGGENHVVPWRPDHDRDIHGLVARTPAHLTFTPEEERRGWAALCAMGIPIGIPFICFHARDSTYLQTIFPGTDLGYHNYRDSTIHNCVPAVENLVRRGYVAVRVGAIVKEALNITNPDIIDYATNGSRTDFLDVFLGAKCHFFIGDTTGINCIPMVFRRPRVIVNMIPLEYAYTWSPIDLFIPKKHWLRAGRRYMTFREILGSGAGRFLFKEQFEQQDIELIENTPEEIAALAIEMDQRLKGTWQTTEEDEELQRRFWALFKPSELHGKILSRIGTEFLRQHRDWLE